MNVRNSMVVLLITILLAGFQSAAAAESGDIPINLIPMYGYPEIGKPERLKKADEKFISDVIKEFGTRERASQAFAYYGWQNFRKGDLETAMRRFNQSWLLNRDSYLPYWGFGATLNAQHKANEATLYFEKALALIEEGREKARLLNDAARAYTVQGMQASNGLKAKALFDHANRLHMESEKLDPQYGSNYRTWGLSLCLEGKYQMAWEKIRKADKLGAQPLPPKIMRRLKEEMPVAGIHWSRGIIGAYQSEISGGRNKLSGVTRFSINSAGQLIGAYSYQEDTKTVKGELSDCTEIKRKHALSCFWKDKYGTGMLVMGFSDDLRSFDGYWNTYGSLRRLPWNGKQ